MECSETQVATSSLTLFDKRKCSVLFLAHRAFMHKTAVQQYRQKALWRNIRS